MADAVDQSGHIIIDTDDDSTFGDDTGSETTSLISAVYDYIYENGRRYHSYKAGAYWGPNDDQAQDNLDLFHHVFNLTFDGKLYHCPLPPTPQRVLDLGTGTGIWAIDFADAHPTASVIATDLSPIQPELTPPNLEFQIDDFTQPWTFTPSSFDFIHARSLYGSISDYASFHTEVLKALKPGAWFEQTEISVMPTSDDGSINGTTLQAWGKLGWECGEKTGKSFKIAEESGDLFKKAGFENVVYKQYKWPIGTWPKDKKLKRIGAYNRLGCEEGIEGWAMFLLTTFMGWQPEEIQVLIAGFKNDIRNPAIHAYQMVSVCYGQKPMR